MLRISKNSVIRKQKVLTIEAFMKNVYVYIIKNLTRNIRIKRTLLKILFFDLSINILEKFYNCFNYLNVILKNQHF